MGFGRRNDFLARRRAARAVRPVRREFSSASVFQVVVVVALAAWVAHGLFGSSHGMMRVMRLRRENASLALESVRLGAVADSLAREESLATTPQYLERVAREDNGLVRRGETVYRITEVPSGDSARSDNPVDRSGTPR